MLKNSRKIGRFFKSRLLISQTEKVLQIKKHEYEFCVYLFL